MALIHQAQLVPSKLDLLRSWIPDRSWVGDADTTSLRAIGAYRFDDPDGEVGIETHLVATGDGQVLHVPLTYRGSPLAGAESALVSTMEHSVLGRRWVYDAVADPVYRHAVLATILTGGTQAELEYPAGAAAPEVTTRVRGTGGRHQSVPDLGVVSVADGGSASAVSSEGVHLEVIRLVDSDRRAGDGPALLGTWPGQTAAAVLAVVRLT